MTASSIAVPSTDGPHADPLVESGVRPSFLRVLAAGEAPRHQELTPGRISIGSSPRCTIRVAGAGVQPLHCTLQVDERGAQCKSWGADAWRNGETFRSVPLEAGDVLQVGAVRLVAVEQPDDPVDPARMAPVWPGPQIGVHGADRALPSLGENTRLLDGEALDRRLFADRLVYDLAQANQTARQRLRRCLGSLRTTKQRAASMERNIADLENRLGESWQEQSQQRELCERLQQQATEAEHAAAALEQVDVISAELGEVEAELATTQNELAERTAANEMLEQRIAELEAALARQGKTAERIAALGDRFREAQRLSEQREEQLVALQEEKTRLEQQQADLDEQAREQQQRADRLAEQLSEAKQQDHDAIRAATERCRELADQAETMGRRLAETTAESQQRATELQALERQQRAWETERLEMETRLAEQASRIAALTVEHAQAAAEPDPRDEQLASAQAQCDDLKRQLDARLADVAEGEQRSTALESQAAALREQLEQVQSQLATAETQLRQTESDVEQARAELAQVQQAQHDDEASQQQAAEALREQLEQVQSQLAAAETQLSQAESDAQQARDELNQVQEAQPDDEATQQRLAEAEALREQLEQVQSQLAAAETQLSQAESDAQQARDELNQIQQAQPDDEAIQQRLAEAEALREQLEQVQSQLAAAETQLSQAESDAQQARAELNEVQQAPHDDEATQQRLAEAEARVEALTAELEASRAENERLSDAAEEARQAAEVLQSAIVAAPTDEANHAESDDEADSEDEANANYSQPTSFFEQYKHLLPDEDGPVETAVSEAVQEPARPPLLPASDDDDAESLEQYMAEMMQRVRTSAPAATASFAPTPVKSPPRPMRSDLPAEDLADADEKSMEPIDLDQLRSSSQKPPLASDLVALRSLANSEARKAIATSHQRRDLEILATKLFGCVVAVGASIYLVSAAPRWQSLMSIGGCLPALAGLYAGFKFSVQLVKVWESRRAAAAEDSSPAETAPELPAEVVAANNDASTDASTEADDSAKDDADEAANEAADQLESEFATDFATEDESERDPEAVG